MVKELLFQVLILLGSLVILDKASDITTRNSIRVARITGFTNTTVGFLLVAFATSLPELLIALFAAFMPDTIGVAIGNVLGSNIVNICLILGICFLWMGVRDPGKLESYLSGAKKETGSLYLGIFIASVIPLVLLSIGQVSRIVGAVLIFIFAYYLYRLSRVRGPREETGKGSEAKGPGKYILLSLLGAMGIVASSYFLVDSASSLAITLGIPRVVIGATVVAFGTSIPELATSLSATRKGYLDLALGNIIGSCFINITLILGVALILSPFQVNIAAFANLVFFTVLTNLFFWYFLSSERFSWREGLILLGIYVTFLVASFSGYGL
ncbi:MAG: sodium:calcium antiporter [Methanomicrobiales archaeon]|nr:sodium:calcium antiporter [Methanomicrobiales archaeon]